MFTRAQYRVWAEVDCAALRHNFHVIQSYLPMGTGVMAVLKANAYGHGAIASSKVLLEEGASMIGVGDSQEAIELRQNGIEAPILILGAVIPGEMEQVIRNSITVNIHTIDMLREVNAVAERLGVVAEAHLMVDSGMGRLGATPDEAISILQVIRRCRSVKLTGLCTHFSSPTETSPNFSKLQMTRFNQVVDASARLGFGGVTVHAASHAAMLRYPEARYDMVRPGLALWGMTGIGHHPANDELQSVLALRTQIVQLKDVPEGTPIGYGRLWYAPAPTRIATLPIGYNDGFPVGLTGKSEVLIRGVRCPVVGRVSMDYIMVDAGAVPEARVGDTVTVIGRDGSQEIKVRDIAAVLGTVPYEITCRLGRRVKRVYTNQSAALFNSARYGAVTSQPRLIGVRTDAA